MCARHGRGSIEICLSEKGALAKNRLGNTAVEQSAFCTQVSQLAPADKQSSGHE